MKRILSFSTLLAFGSACGGATPAASTIPVSVPEVDDASLGSVLRDYRRLRPGNPQREAMQEALLAHYASEGAAILEAGDFDAVVAHFRSMTDLLAPEDFSRELPSELQAIARWLVDNGSPRGDEARVMAALLVLRAIAGDSDQALREEYELVSSWGRDARSQIPLGVERFSSLIRVWDEHANLAPSPEVLDTLANLHVERRDSVLTSFRENPAMMMRFRGGAAQLMRITPLDVAAVFLQHGELGAAVAHVEGLREAGQTEARLLEVLNRARQNNDDGARALLEMAEAFAEARPAVSLGICRLGLQRFANNADFPVCLARMAAVDQNAEGATGWYLEAIEAQPEQRDLYVEALEQIRGFIARGTDSQNADEARALAERARMVLAAHQERWPTAASPVPAGQFEMLLGTAEMRAGNTDAAKTHFEASLAEDESSAALLELGTLEERLGDPNVAARHYRRALDLTDGSDFDSRQDRAYILEHLGDAFRRAGRDDQAQRMYRQAAELVDGLVEEFQAAVPLEGLEMDSAPRMALAWLRLRSGVLQDRLGNRERMEADFRAAMADAPHRQSVYASVLSHLVVSTPNAAFAAEVYRIAQRQLTLEADWKVYFALWVNAVAAQEGVESSAEARSMLERMSGTAGWIGKLAQLGSGASSYDDVLAAADDAGQRAEAHFYEASRRIAAGDQEGAQALLREVMQTRMVNFFEFAMAQHLLH